MYCVNSWWKSACNGRRHGDCGKPEGWHSWPPTQGFWEWHRVVFYGLEVPLKIELWLRQFPSKSPHDIELDEFDDVCWQTNWIWYSYLKNMVNWMYEFGVLCFWRKGPKGPKTWRRRLILPPCVPASKQWGTGFANALSHQRSNFWTVVGVGRCQRWQPGSNLVWSFMCAQLL